MNSFVLALCPFWISLSIFGFLSTHSLCAYSATQRDFLFHNGHHLSAPALARSGTVTAGYVDWAALIQDSLLTDDRKLAELKNTINTPKGLMFAVLGGVNQSWLTAGEQLKNYNDTLAAYQAALIKNPLAPDSMSERKSLAVVFSLSEMFQVSLQKHSSRQVTADARFLAFQAADENILKLQINFRPFWERWRVGWSIQPTLGAYQLSLYEQPGFTALSSSQFSIWENVQVQNTQYQISPDLNFHFLLNFVPNTQMAWGLRLDADNLLSSPALFRQLALSGDWFCNGPQRDVRVGLFNTLNYEEHRVLFNLEASQLLSDQVALMQKFAASMTFELSHNLWFISAGFKNGDISLGAGFRYHLFMVFMSMYRQQYGLISTDLLGSTLPRGRTVLLELSMNL